jgi:hypothetical protein
MFFCAASEFFLRLDALLLALAFTLSFAPADRAAMFFRLPNDDASIARLRRA